MEATEFLKELKAAMLDNPFKRMAPTTMSYEANQAPYNAAKFEIPMNDVFAYSIHNTGNLAVLIDEAIYLAPFESISFPNISGVPYNNKLRVVWKDEYPVVAPPAPQFQHAYGAIAVIRIEAIEKKKADYNTPNN